MAQVPLLRCSASAQIESLAEAISIGARDAAGIDIKTMPVEIAEAPHAKLEQAQAGACVLRRHVAEIAC